SPGIRVTGVTASSVDTDALAEARRLDGADPLARFRREFVVSDSRLVYLDGNSLGRLPKQAGPRVREGVEREGGGGRTRGGGAGGSSAGGAMAGSMRRSGSVPSSPPSWGRPPAMWSSRIPRR